MGKCKQPVVLCILDGWGYRENKKNNALVLASTPYYDSILANYPNGLLLTSGQAVGLPEGQMGNSEVGHMTIGSGRVIMQELPRIDNAIKNGELKQNQSLLNFIDKLKESGGACHLLGLVSDGGVHSHIDHILALAAIVADNGIKVFIHVFTDGRDVSPHSAKDYIARLERGISAYANVGIATVSGRYYAMDRDKRWERVELAYNAIVAAKAEKIFSDANQVVNDSYKNNISDEFIKPCVVGGYKGACTGDGILMANFRADRARQILEAVLLSDFIGFNRVKHIRFAANLGMIGYSDILNNEMAVLFEPQKLTNILGEVIANKGLKQLRIAETEKYAHVTFFFNGGREQNFVGEERILVPSPNVSTYDLQPEMSAFEVTDKLIDAVDDNKFDFIVVNYANADMVGHTGNQDAAIKAVEALDRCFEKLVKKVLEKDGVIIITADHGNVEMMVDDVTGAAHTAHTKGPVPFIIVGKDVVGDIVKEGSLADIAPTVLYVLGINKPSEMTGNSLVSM